MTANELDTMVKAMRTKRNKLETRMDLEDAIWYLYKGLLAIDRKDIARELRKLYEEVDEISTMSLMKVGTFK